MLISKAYRICLKLKPIDLLDAKLKIDLAERLQREDRPAHCSLRPYWISTWAYQDCSDQRLDHCADERHESITGLMRPIRDDIFEENWLSSTQSTDTHLSMAARENPRGRTGDTGESHFSPVPVRYRSRWLHDRARSDAKLMHQAFSNTK